MSALWTCVSITTIVGAGAVPFAAQHNKVKSPNTAAKNLIVCIKPKMIKEINLLVLRLSAAFFRRLHWLRGSRVGGGNDDSGIIPLNVGHGNFSPVEVDKLICLMLTTDGHHNYGMGRSIRSGARSTTLH